MGDALRLRGKTHKEDALQVKTQDRPCPSSYSIFGPVSLLGDRSP
jgi:hypothetical protein